MINSFTGKYRFLSNFWPVQVTLDGMVYPSVEHAYQAAKTDSYLLRIVIREAPTAGEAKRAGRELTVRKDWDNIKLYRMEGLIYQKFQYEDLREKLLSTGDQELIEGNTWGDTFWGQCKGQGHNYLGKILMKVRDFAKEF
jgi:ribA/ribD-fused uncharacterized protein